MRDLKLSFTDAYETDTSWIVADALCSACFELDKKTGRADYLFSFEGERPLQSGVYHQIYSCGNELFFVPGYAGNICVWNPDTGERAYYAVKENGDDGHRYVDSCRIGDELWLLPSALEQPIVKFDMRKRRAEYWAGHGEGIPEETADKKKPVFFRQYVRSGRKVYAVVGNSPYLACTDLDKKKTSVKRVGDYSLTDLCPDGNAFWFSMQGSGDILRWDAETGAAELYPSESAGEGKGYSNLIKSSGGLLLVPETGNRLMRVNPERKRVEAFCRLPKELGRMGDERAGWRRFFFYRNLGDIVRLYPNQADLMVDIYVKERRAVGRGYRLEPGWYREVFREKFLNAHFAEELSGERAEAAETWTADLDAYLAYVGQAERKTPEAGGGGFGEAIHRALDCG